MKFSFTKIIVLTTFLAFMGSINNILAQNEDDLKSLGQRIDETVNTLSLKLLLSDKQKDLVHKIVTGNISDSTINVNKESVLKDINEMIESSLTARQKSKFNILKSNWLDGLYDSSEKK